MEKSPKKPYRKHQTKSGEILQLKPKKSPFQACRERFELLEQDVDRLVLDTRGLSKAVELHTIAIEKKIEAFGVEYVLAIAARSPIRFVMHDSSICHGSLFDMRVLGSGSQVPEGIYVASVGTTHRESLPAAATKPQFAPTYSHLMPLSETAQQLLTNLISVAPVFALEPTEP